MTTELTKAAQQALEACPFCDGPASFCASERGWTAYLHAACDQCGARSPSISYSIRHNGIDPETREYLPPKDRQREVAKLWNTRALTQRPAAQTEREAFERAALAKWGPLDFERSEAVPEMYYNQRLDDAWIGFGFAVAWLRASLPAPQQATPTRATREAEQRARMQARLAARHEGKATADFDLPPPNDAIQQATPEWLHLKSYGYAPGNYMSKCLRCDQITPDLDKRATSCRPCAEAAHALQQATPEPVPRSVFIAGNETAMCAFASRDLAERYVSNFGGATAGGMTVVELPVVGATPEPVQADSSEHLRVIASLGAALRRLSFAAQTSGGTAGPDAELQAAIWQAEQALSFGGIAQAMFATPPQQAAGEPVAWRWMPSHVFPTWVYSDDQNRVADARRFMGDGGVQALYTHPAPGVPEGFALVPVEPTEKMLRAYTGGVLTEAGFRWCRHQWAAMLAAAQAKGGEQ